MSEELKPCPFCGKKAKISLGGFGEVFAECINDNCVIQPSSWQNSKEDAIKAWNSRTVLAGQGEQIGI